MSNTMASIKSLEVQNKKVLVRVDFNVPLNKESGEITDTTRIEKALPTLEYLLKQGASLILMSHMGRPKSKDDTHLSMKTVTEKLKTYLPDRDIQAAPDVIGSETEEMAAGLEQGAILVLENVRYYKEETSKEKETRKSFAQKITKMADAYVNDAFGAAHRAHASIVECAEELPHAAGFLLAKEIEVLEKLMKNPERPFVAVIGGAKVSSKLKVLQKLMTKVDTILIGGAMSYTFLKSRLLEVGDSMVEKDYLSDAFQIIDKADYHEIEFKLPEDHVVANEFSEKAKTKTMKKQISNGWMGMDIGPKTADSYAKIIKKAKTVLWNGPMGVFEMKPFSKGTNSIAKALTKVKGMTIVGGGDSVYAVKEAGVEDKIGHISTGGGATLEYIEGKELPGVKVLSE